MKRAFLEKRQFKMPGGAIVSALVAQDPATDELLDTYPVGKRLGVDIKDDRDRGELRLYWAGLSLLVKNFSGPDPVMVEFPGPGDNVVMVDAVSCWPTSRDVHNMLMGATGHEHKVWRRDGTYTMEVDSIAIDRMLDDEFKLFMELATAILVEMFGFDPFQEWKNLKDDEAARRHAANQNWQRNWREGDRD